MTAFVISEIDGDVGCVARGSDQAAAESVDEAMSAGCKHDWTGLCPLCLRDMEEERIDQKIQNAIREAGEERVRVERWHATYNAAVSSMPCHDLAPEAVDFQARAVANQAHGELKR